MQKYSKCTGNCKLAFIHTSVKTKQILSENGEYLRSFGLLWKLIE